MLRRLLALMVIAGVIAPAVAFPPFQKQFLAKYADGTDEAFTKLAKSDAKCLVCHQGKSKKHRNPYGEALSELIGKKDQKNADKIVSALEEVAKKPSNAEDPASPTFGDLIAEGKLPGGDLEALKAEPAK